MRSGGACWDFDSCLIPGLWTTTVRAFETVGRGAAIDAASPTRPTTLWPSFFISHGSISFLSACSQVDQSVDDLNNGAGIFASGDQRSAIVNDTILYLPYCTGDVHTGKKFRCVCARECGFPSLGSKSNLRKCRDRILVTRSVSHWSHTRSSSFFLRVFC